MDIVDAGRQSNDQGLARKAKADWGSWVDLFQETGSPTTGLKELFGEFDAVEPESIPVRYT